MTTTVLQLSDMHLASAPREPAYGRDPDARLAAVLTAWADRDEPADLVVLTGDNTDSGAAEAYARLATTLRPLDAPVLAVPGNHDVPHRVAAVFGTRQTAEVDAWRVVGLNSARPHQVHGTVDVAAATELLDRLDDQPTVVAIHHPPLSPSRHEWFQLDGAAELLDALAARPHVRALISGHLHAEFDYDGPGNLSLLGCPSTLIGIEHHGDSYEVGGNAPTGARVLHLEDDGTVTSSLLTA